MSTRSISLTAEQDAFVRKVVEAGEYQNASEAIAMPCAYSSSAGRKTARFMAGGG